MGSIIGPNRREITALFNVIIIDKAVKLVSFRTSSPQEITTAQAILAIMLIIPNCASFQGEFIVGVLSSPYLGFM